MSEDDIRRYEQMLAGDPDSRAFAPLAEAYRKAGRLEDAIRTARAGLEVHPGYSGGLLVLGRTLYESRELEPAVEVLRKAVADSPENYLGQKFLGKALMDKGDVQGGLRALEAANFLSPEDEEVARLLEELKKKAQPPREMVFEAGSAHGSDEAQIVTYEQKPTTVDGIELEPLPNAELFSFSPDGEEVTLDPTAVRPVAAGSAPAETAPEEEDVVEVSGDGFLDEVEDLEDTAGLVEVDDIDDIDQFDPEIAAFIEEGETLAETAMEEKEPEGEAAEWAPPPAPAAVPAPPAQEPVETAPVISAAADVPVPGMPVSAAEPETVAVPEPPTPVAPPLPPAGQVSGAAVFPEIPEPPVAEREESLAGPGSEVSFKGPDPEAAFDLDLDLEMPQDNIGLEPAAPEVRLFEPSSPPSLDASATGGPISTETLADLYARQGLTDKALEIYRQILAERPGDEAVMGKISALQVATRQPAPPAAQAPSATPGGAGIGGQAAPGHAVPAPGPHDEAGDGTPGEPASQGDVTETLMRWLENAERMKNR